MSYVIQKAAKYKKDQMMVRPRGLGGGAVCSFHDEPHCSLVDIGSQVKVEVVRKSVQESVPAPRTNLSCILTPGVDLCFFS